MRLYVVTIAFIFSTSLVLADSRPSSGVVFGTIDRNYIEYDCSSRNGREMECRFTQLKIRNKANPDELAERLKRVPEVLKEIGSDPSKSGCADIPKLIASVEAGKPPEGAKPEEFQKAMREMHPTERADMLSGLKAFAAVCAGPTESNVKAMLEAELRKDTRTCHVLTNTFTQKFTQTQSGNWVHTSEPRGECGSVFITEFEKEKDDRLSLWNYRSRKVVTNPTGTDVVMKCSDLDQGTYTYSWRKPLTYRGCDYIDFGF